MLEERGAETRIILRGGALHLHSLRRLSDICRELHKLHSRALAITRLFSSSLLGSSHWSCRLLESGCVMMAAEVASSQSPQLLPAAATGDVVSGVSCMGGHLAFSGLAIPGWPEPRLFRNDNLGIPVLIFRRRLKYPISLSLLALNDSAGRSSSTFHLPIFHIPIPPPASLPSVPALHSTPLLPWNRSMTLVWTETGAMVSPEWSRLSRNGGRHEQGVQGPRRPSKLAEHAGG